MFSNATRDGSRKFWGQVLVKHPENLDQLLLDLDVANSRRNVESWLSLVKCIVDARRLGLRRELVLGERWQTLTTPTLLVWGTATPSDHRTRVRPATNPNLDFVQVVGAGHLPWLDAPDTVVAEIGRFLATASGVEAAV